MRRVASHLDTSDNALAVAAKRFCQAVGPSVVPMLAETLSREDRTRSRQHLIGILTSFGAAGRDVIERLMQSPNAAVRRTAVLLLREFGGFDALPQLEAMLHDHEPHVQREATRAIATMGVELAYETLTRALLRGTDAVRTSLTGVLCSLPLDEAAGALAHLVTKAPLGGSMGPLHDRALQRLGAAQGQVVIAALGDALRRGSLMAPLRTRTLRRQAADALGRIGTAEALEQLHAAAVGGTWGMRAAAKAALATTTRGDTRRGGRER
jgi:HEAT repeat protein